LVQCRIILLASSLGYGISMFIFSDFDGTLTVDGRITSEFFQILHLIEKKNHELIIVSGRSLSWGQFLLTHFPLNSCIMEGGGVILTKDHRGEIKHSPLVSQHELSLLESFTQKMRSNFPQVPLSADSFGRLSDRAVEYKFMDEGSLDNVIEFMKLNEINFTKSNVHLNFWKGEISKFLGVKRFIEEHYSHENLDNHLFFGDAPNDESMFELFKNSIGVSNIRHCLDKLNHRPSIILEGEDKEGAKGVLHYLSKTL
jgi:HAD superfamily hydrolase (TIGR01484 family)